MGAVGRGLPRISTTQRYLTWPPAEWVPRCGALGFFGGGWRVRGRSSPAALGCASLCGRARVASTHNHAHASPPAKALKLQGAPQRAGLVKVTKRPRTATHHRKSPLKLQSAPQRAPPRLVAMLNNNGSRNARQPTPTSAHYRKCFM